jgi:hypothetical protein
MYTKTDYLSEVRPVARERKTLTLMEQSIDRVAFGFDATLDEISDFYRRTYVYGAEKIEELRNRRKLCTKYRILLGNKCLYDESGKWWSSGKYSRMDVWNSAFTETGETYETFSSAFMGNEKDLFHYFGLELYDEIEKIQPFIIEAFNAGGKVIAKMNKSGYVIAEILESELTEAGQMVVEAARRQSNWLKSLLVPENGRLRINIWEASDWPSDDMLVVKLASTLSWRERVYDMACRG